MSWTNLSECGTLYMETFLPENDIPAVHPIYEEWFPIIKKVTYLGYILSFLSLLLSVCILVKIKYVYTKYFFKYTTYNYIPTWGR